MNSIARPRLLNPVRPGQSSGFGSQAVSFQHSLHYSELFQDLVLTQLLERAPVDKIRVNSGTDPYFSRYGTCGNLEGVEILQAIRHGKLSVQVSRPETIIPEFGSVLEILYNDLKMALPEANISRKMLKIQISSPGLVFPMSFDVSGRALWQIRGERQISIYPGREPFISPREMESALIENRSHHALAYADWFEQFADCRELVPGQLLHWPFNQPYRIANSKLMNVSVITQLWSSEEEKIHTVNLGNAMLRRMGAGNLGQSTTGAAYHGKRLLAKTRKMRNRMRGRWKRFGAGRTAQDHRATPIDFVVEPRAPEGMRDLNRVSPF